MKGRVLIQAILILVVLLTIVPRAAGQSFDRVLHVDIGHAAASNQNPGTPDRPLQTLKAAVVRALEYKRNNLTTRVAVHAGVYREGHIKVSGAANATLLLIESAGDGPVIISGSDIYTGWTRMGDGTYTHPWSFDWGTGNNPWGEGAVAIGDEARRREMVYVDTVRMAQVLDRRNLTPGTFFVDESADLIRLYPPGRKNPNVAVTEVGVDRDQLLSIEHTSNVTVRGIAFKHSTGHFRTDVAVEKQAFLVRHASDITIENCTFYHNNWKGLAAVNTSGLTIRGVTSNYNGGDAMSSYKLSNALIEDFEFGYNNWRGAMGGFETWAVGQKFLLQRNVTFRSGHIHDNASSGLWFDADIEGITLKDIDIYNNKAGLKTEATQGPVTVDNCRIYNNKIGFSGAESEQIYIYNSHIYDNEKQILITGSSGGRGVTNHVTGQRMTLYNRTWTIRNNIILGGAALFHSHLSSSDWTQFRNALVADGNIYFHATNPNVFVGQSFDQWQAETGQDLKSSFGEPDKSQNILLREGWNYVCGWITPANPGLETLLDGVRNNIVLMKDVSGRVFEPEKNINTIGDWRQHEVYMMYMRSDARLTITGWAGSRETLTIPLSRGWNTVPYPGDQPIAVEEALASIASELVVVKSPLGHLYAPKYSINEIGMLTPGHGYRIYVDRAVDMTYPAGTGAASNTATVFSGKPASF